MKDWSVLLFALIAISTLAWGRESYVQTCWNRTAGDSTIPFNSRGIFRPECAPDTLYSWQKFRAVNWAAFSQSFLVGTSLYTFRTPLATFGYGDVQIRIKLRPNVRFKLLDHDRERSCARFPAIEKENTVYVYASQFSEYLICSEKVAESWSTRTLGSQIEAQNEKVFLERYGAALPQIHDAYVMNIGRTTRWEAPYLNPFFPVIDGLATDWRANTLLDRVASSSRVDIPEMGRVYGPEVNATIVQRHFSTGVPSYFALNRDEVARAVSALGFVSVPNRVEILSASYGLNLGPERAGNTTEKAREFCGGREECRFELLESQASTPPQDLEITYRCSLGEEVYRVYIPAPANRQVRILSCPAPTGS